MEYLTTQTKLVLAVISYNFARTFYISVILAHRWPDPYRESDGTPDLHMLEAVALHAKNCHHYQSVGVLSYTALKSPYGTRPPPTLGDRGDRVY